MPETTTSLTDYVNFQTASILILLTLIIIIGVYYFDSIKQVIPTSSKENQNKKNQNKASRLEIGKPIIPETSLNPEISENELITKTRHLLTPSVDQIQKITSSEKIEKIRALIIHSGNPYNMRTIQEYYSHKSLMSVIFSITLTVFTIIFLGYQYLILGLAAGLLIGWFFVDMDLKSKSKKRTSEILRVLPETLDIMTVILNTGATFETAYAKTAKIIPDSILAKEIRTSAAQIKSGQSMTDSLDQLANKFDSQELRSFVTSVKRSLISGSDMTKILAKNSELIRDSYFSLVRQFVNKLETKMTVIMIALVLPAFLITLLYPQIAQMNMPGIGGGTIPGM